MKRQGMKITTGQLHKLIEDLEKEHTKWEDSIGYLSEEQEFQINIINKTPECSDTWEIDNSQQIKKDEEVTITTDNHLETRSKAEADNKKMGKTVDVDNQSVDKDPLTKTSNEASRIDGDRLSLFEKAGQVVMKEDKKLMEELAKC